MSLNTTLVRRDFLKLGSATTLGVLTGEKHVTFIAACNGGGFKFSSAYGEALADLATTGKTELPIEFMNPA